MNIKYKKVLCTKFSLFVYFFSIIILNTGCRQNSSSICESDGHDYDKTKTGKYLVINNIDILIEKGMKVYLKPHRDYSYYYLNEFKRKKSYVDFGNIKEDTSVLNVKEILIEIVGKKPKYLYYEPSGGQ